jgi:hypothetical protein
MEKISCGYSKINIHNGNESHNGSTKCRPCSQFIFKWSSNQAKQQINDWTLVYWNVLISLILSQDPSSLSSLALVSKTCACKHYHKKNSKERENNDDGAIQEFRWIHYHKKNCKNKIFCIGRDGQIQILS